VAVPLLVVPAGLLMLESLVGRPLYVDRYVLYGEAGVALLAGGGAYRIGRWLAGGRALAGSGALAGGQGGGGAGGQGLAGAGAGGRALAGNKALAGGRGLAGGGGRGRNALVVVPGVAVCLCALLLQLGAQHRARTPQIRLYDFGGPSRYIAAHAHRGDGVLYLTDFFRKAELGYPADFRHVSDFALAVPPATVGNFQGQDKPLATIERLMLGYSRIWVLGRGPQAVLPPGTARAELALLNAHFRLMSTHHYRHVVVSLWVRGAVPSG
jgi:mannosyltransferase